MYVCVCRFHEIMHRYYIKCKIVYMAEFWWFFLSLCWSGTSSRRVWRALTLAGITASPSWITTISSWPVFWWWFCPSFFTCSVWDAYTAAPHSTAVPPLPSSGWKRAWVRQTSLSPYRAWSLSVKQLANHWRRAFLTHLSNEGALLFQNESHSYNHHVCPLLASFAFS